MAPDLLSTIRHEIDERLNGLRPLLAEHERLLVAAEALKATAREAGSRDVARTASPSPRTRRRTQRNGNIAGSAEPVTDAWLDEVSAVGRQEEPTPASARRVARKPKSSRAVRGAAREAILAALEHGSHTVGELSVVTAMSGPNINGNLRRLAGEGVVVKTEREGKTAWSLSEPVV